MYNEETTADKVTKLSLARVLGGFLLLGFLYWLPIFTFYKYSDNGVVRDMFGFKIYQVPNAPKEFSAFARYSYGKMQGYSYFFTFHGFIVLMSSVVFLFLLSGAVQSPDTPSKAKIMFLAIVSILLGCYTAFFCSI